jgi:hypothetical protein
MRAGERRKFEQCMVMTVGSMVWLEFRCRGRGEERVD